jgi:hypothetical protein
MRPTFLKYVHQVEEVGKTLSDALSLALSLECRYLRDNLLQPEHILLFRCFQYPTRQQEDSGSYGT